MLTINEEKINSYLKIEAEEVEAYVEPVNTTHSCPLCRSVELVKNGSYVRNLIYFKRNKICIRRMRMQRYKCNCCGKTRSHYPKFVVPRREYSLGTLLFMGLSRESRANIAADKNIPEMQIRNVRKEFKEIRKRIKTITAVVTEMDLENLIEKYTTQFGRKPFEAHQRDIHLQSSKIRGYP